MNTNDTIGTLEITKDKSAEVGRKLVLVLALCMASYLPGRWIIEQGARGMAWAKLTAREGLAAVVAWDMGHFEISIDTKGKQIIGADTRSKEQLQAILYRVLVHNQEQAATLEDVKDQLIGVNISLDIHKDISAPIQNN